MHFPIVRKPQRADKLVLDVALGSAFNYRLYNYSLTVSQRSSSLVSDKHAIIANGDLFSQDQFEQALSEDKPETFFFYVLQLLHFYGQAFITRKCQLHYQNNYGQAAENKDPKPRESNDYAKPPKIRVAETPMVAPRMVVFFPAYQDLTKDWFDAQQFHRSKAKPDFLKQLFRDNTQGQRCGHAATQALFKLPKLLKVLNTALNITTVQELQLWGIRFTNFIVGKALLGQFGHQIGLAFLKEPTVSLDKVQDWIKAIERGVSDFFPLSLEHLYGEPFCLSSSTEEDPELYKIYRELQSKKGKGPEEDGRFSAD